MNCGFSIRWFWLYRYVMFCGGGPTTSTVRFANSNSLEAQPPLPEAGQFGHGYVNSLGCPDTGVGVTFAKSKLERLTLKIDSMSPVCKVCGSKVLTVAVPLLVEIVFIGGLKSSRTT